MLSLLVLAGLFATATAKPCVGFDANWGLYVFGFDHDVSLGPSAAWNANPVGTSTLTKNGRPPFNGPNTQCFFSQYQNSLYVLNADTTQPSNIHIFSFETQTWSTQAVNADGTDPNSLLAILDRNTNVFFALSKSQLYSLDMGTLAQADGSTKGWQFVQEPAFAQNNAYPKPVMALAQNHIHFLNIGKPATAEIFVIHFSYMQPDAQVFSPIEDGGVGAPSTTGQTASIFKGVEDAQSKFAFIPDDGASTFVFDVISNTTQTLKGPLNKSTQMIAASQRELVQLTNSGEIYWFPYSPEDAQANYGANWSKIALNLAPATTGAENPTSLPGSSSPRPLSTGTISTTASRSSASRLSAIWHSGIAALGLSVTGLWFLL